MVPCFGAFGNCVCILVIVFETLFVGVFEACHGGMFLYRGFASAWRLWALPVLDNLLSDSEFEVLWNLQARQTQLQIHVRVDLWLLYLRDRFLFFPPPSFPSPPMGVVEASLLLVDTYSEDVVSGVHLMWRRFFS